MSQLCSSPILTTSPHPLHFSSSSGSSCSQPRSRTTQCFGASVTTLHMGGGWSTMWENQDHTRVTLGRAHSNRTFLWVLDYLWDSTSWLIFAIYCFINAFYFPIIFMLFIYHSNAKFSRPRAKWTSCVLLLIGPQLIHLHDSQVGCPNSFHQQDPCFLHLFVQNATSHCSRVWELEQKIKNNIPVLAELTFNPLLKPIRSCIAPLPTYHTVTPL